MNRERSKRKKKKGEKGMQLNLSNYILNQVVLIKIPKLLQCKWIKVNLSVKSLNANYDSICFIKLSNCYL